MARFRDIFASAMSYAVITVGTVVIAAEDDVVETPSKAGVANDQNVILPGGQVRLVVRRMNGIQQQGLLRAENAVVMGRRIVPIQDSQVDRWVFGMDLNTARSMLQDQIERKVREISNRYDLSPEKRNKLTLMARADLFRLLHEAEDLRKRYVLAADDSNEVIAVERQAAVLRQRQHDLLGPDSFFAKSAKAFLQRESLASQYAALDDSQYKRHLSNVESAIRPIERVVELRPAQRERLIDLLLKDAHPPRVFGDFDDTVIKYQLGTTPESTLKSILDKDQWPAVRPVLDGFLEFRPGLLRRGLIPSNTSQPSIAPDTESTSGPSDAEAPTNRVED